MQKIKSKLILLLLLNFLVVLLFNQVVLAKPENIEPTINSKIELEGFRLQYTEKGELQALVDVTLYDINATGVEFNLVYDNTYIEPSSYDTNEPTTDIKQFFFPNPTVFPEAPSEGAYGPKFRGWLNYGFSEIKDKQIFMTLIPDSNAPEKNYVGTCEVSMPEPKILKTLKTSGRSAMVGTMSFRVVNEEALAALKPEQVTEILKVSSTGQNAVIIYADKDKIERFKDISIPITLQYTPIEKPETVIYLTGKIRSLLPTTETVIDVYRYDADGNQVDKGPVKSFASLTRTEDGIEEINGTSWVAIGQLNGMPFTEWDFKIPISLTADDKYTYKMDIRKVSHQRKENITINFDDVQTTPDGSEKYVQINNSYTSFIPLFYGDFNDDGYVNDVDRAYFVHLYNKSGSDKNKQITFINPDESKNTASVIDMYDFNCSGIVDSSDMNVMMYAIGAYLQPQTYWAKSWTKAYQKYDEKTIENTDISRFVSTNPAHRVEHIYQ